MKRNLSEDDVIRIARSIFHTHEETNLGFADDAGLMMVGDQKLIISTDSVVEGVHIPVDSAPETYAWRLSCRALSDIAAMGGTPCWCTLNIKFNASMNKTWIRAFYRELDMILTAHNVSLVGGDTVCDHEDKLALSMTVIGKANTLMKRSQGYEGERLYVSGTIGDAFLGYKILMNALGCNAKADREYLLDAYLRPSPQVKLGMHLSQLSSCAIDVSDGLIMDASKLAQTSRLMAYINLEDIPLSQAAMNVLKGYRPTDRAKLLLEMITWGDDYQLLFSLPVTNSLDVLDLAAQTQCSLTKIGHLAAFHGDLSEGTHADFVRVFDKKGAAISMKTLGFQHAA